MVHRTPRLHPALIHSYINIKEKGLLLLEQPSAFSSNLKACTGRGNGLEHLPEFEDFIMELHSELTSA